MATYYVRPVGTTYGSGLGTSYADAFSGSAGINWTSIVSTDTLYICGSHRERVVLRKNVICRLDYSLDPGTIYGSDIKSSWTPVGSEWQTTVTSKPNVVAVDGVCLSIGSAVGSLTGSQYAFSGASSPFTLSISVNPTGKTVEVGQRARGLVIGGASTDTFSDLKIYGGGVGSIKFVGANDGTAQSTTTGVGKGIAVGDDTWAANNFTGSLLVDGITFDGCGEQGFHFNQTGTGAPSLINITCTNNKFYQTGGESIYIKSCSGTVTTEGNTIDGSVGLRPGWAGTMNGGSFSGDGIDIGGSATVPVVRIRNNIIKSLYGNGIVLATASIDALVEGNTVTDCYMPGYLSTTQCLYLDMQSTSGGKVIIRGNRFEQTNAGTAHFKNASVCTTTVEAYGNIFKTADQTQSNLLWDSFNFRNYNIRNNTVVGGLYAFSFTASADPTSVLVSYNIISGCNKVFYHTRTITSGFTVSSNICYPTGLDANPYVIGNTSYATIALLEAAKAEFTLNISSNPLIDVNGVPASSSPAIATGTKYWNTGPRPSDLNGKPLPDYFIDIGAVQSTYNTFHPANIG